MSRGEYRLVLDRRTATHRPLGARQIPRVGPDDAERALAAIPRATAR